MKAVTLLYHDVIKNGDYTASGFQSSDANFYKLTEDIFVEHIEAIFQQHKIKAEDLSALKNNGHTPFFISFDDGGSSFLNPIADILERFGWVGLFFISTDYIDTPGFLTRDEVRELSKRGHVIGSHSCSHPIKITNYSYDEILAEWTKSKSVLETIIGSDVTTASIPGGFLSNDIERSAAEAGYLSLFTSEPQKKINSVNGCLVLGRYSIAQGVETTTAVRLANKRFSFYQAWQYIFWNIKKLAKKLCGSLYARFRLKLLS